MDVLQVHFDSVAKQLKFWHGYVSVQTSDFWKLEKLPLIFLISHLIFLFWYHGRSYCTMLFIPDIIMYYLNYQFYHEMAFLDSNGKPDFFLVQHLYEQIARLKTQTLFFMKHATAFIMCCNQ